MIRVIVVDEHALARAGICRLLNDESDIKVLGETDTCEQAVRAARSTCPDVLVLTIHTVSVRTLDGARKFLRQCPDTRIVVVSGDADLFIPEKLFRDGVAGYITQNCDFAELADCIRDVFSGGRYISVELARRLATNRLDRGHASPFENLSHREFQVLLLVTEGKNANEISDRLYISPKTVNLYRHRLMGKLGVRTDVELTHLALKHGVINIPCAP